MRHDCIAGAASHGNTDATDREHGCRARQQGDQLDATTAYDEQGRARQTLSAMRREKRQRMEGNSLDTSRRDRLSGG